MKLTYAEARAEAFWRHGPLTQRSADFMAGWEADTRAKKDLRKGARHGASRRHRERP